MSETPTVPEHSCAGAGCSSGPRTGVHQVNPHSDRCDPTANDVTERHYYGTDVKAAIADWAAFNGRSTARELALEASAEMVNRHGPVSEVYTLERYVAVRYEDPPNRVGLCIARSALYCVEPVLPSFEAAPNANREYVMWFPDADAQQRTSKNSGAAHEHCATCGASLPLLKPEQCDLCGTDL